MAFDPPPLPPTQPSWSLFQIWWQQVLTGLKSELGALAAAQAAQEASEAAAAASVERMGELAPITFYADYTGVINPPSQLPKAVQAKRYNNATDVTALSTWSATTASGDADVSMNAATGVLTINDIGINSVVNVTSTRSVGGTITKPLTLYFTTGNAPSSSGTMATLTSFDPFSGAVFGAVSDEVTLTVAAGGIVDMAAPLTLTTAASGPPGAWEAEVIWQWWDGATWVNQGTEDAATTVVSLLGLDDYEVSDGRITANAQKTGLTPAASEKFRLAARRSSGGVRTLYLSGTATVTTT
jgi:hypothetical protein